MKYIVKILLMFGVLVLSSCSFIRAVPQNNGIDTDIQPYVDNFIETSNGKVTKEQLKGWGIGFTEYDSDDNTVGRCFFNVREIDISYSWWYSTQSELQRRELIFHELGHCILERPHTVSPLDSTGFTAWFERLLFTLGIREEKGYLSDGCPVSIMHPYTLSFRCISKHLDYYDKELFNPGIEVKSER